ncbi:hypothetical protein [Glutamicibacter sp. TV12E]|uniref:hypothetical protein n=1 Tax=Glutamicibacter sp. TV12E TaxID=3446362 RepID=UPI00403452C2
MEILVKAAEERSQSPDITFLFIGIAITFGIGAIGWLINNANENSKWIREERHQAYIEIMRIYSGIMHASKFLMHNSLRIDSYHDKVSIAENKMAILQKKSSNNQEETSRLRAEVKQLAESIAELSDNLNLTLDRIKLLAEELRDTKGRVSIISSDRMTNLLNEMLNEEKYQGLYDPDNDKRKQAFSTLSTHQNHIWEQMVKTARNDLMVRNRLARFWTWANTPINE